MMNVIIQETGETKTLCAVRGGRDDTTYFISVHGGFINGDFTYVKERKACMCSQDTYDRWKKACQDNDGLEERIEELVEMYGADEVDDALDNDFPMDLEDHAQAVHKWLDEVFGIVTIKISKDFGDWVGIERFRWDVYVAEIEKAAREVVGRRMTIHTVFIDHGDSEILVEDVWDEETRREIMDIFDRVDASDERFYHEEAKSVETSN